MSRTESTEHELFSGRQTKIWVAPTKLLYFEKGFVKFTVKIVEYDYATVEDYVMLDVSSNDPTDLLKVGVRVFQRNNLTKNIVEMLLLHKRELLRRTQTHATYDLLLFSMVKSLQSLILWV
jgi:hypothetical protein